MNKAVELAKSFIGINEKDGSHKQIIDIYNSYLPHPRGYKMTYSDAWCATFISALGIKLNITDVIPPECGCERQIELFKKLGTWIENDAYVPKEGDIIYYDWQDSGKGDNTGWSDHVGIVESCDGQTITVIEGNKNDSVSRRCIAVNARYIRGFATPKYPANIVTQEVKPAISTPVTVSSKTSDLEELALEVINGKWGNGVDRKTRLTNAGYNYAEVQTYVNAKLNGTTVNKIANAVIQGKYGNGNTRKTKLKQAGYDYDTIQRKVNELLKT